MNKDNFVYAMENLRANIESDIERYKENKYPADMIEYYNGQKDMLDVILGLVEKGTFEK
ncbi:hypothetical protein [Clostridium magnum]|uniref:Uncharacterized protein n=1 Tax=Clostridium magnum DSM 2767 TaxID=1121326 RepID=A0A162QKZ8_9CLOT|nr:hypothetical protein [Clostridium magnum]KZL88655.1 hypothetical protein CLMAG_59440 [Clostridium magnum DSM 2767]KZL88745.1 hypothetical protein CLMAG_60340 [Clostridium magnum DSM 2767]SHJ61475.1 hypothetical protein SAMN02745944_06236 [Clostridium magnum DSM 2767]